MMRPPACTGRSRRAAGSTTTQAEKLGRPLELAVAIGTDPALLMATIAALPENIDEAMFAGFLRGKRTEFMRGASIGIDVPAHAEFILEGIVRPGERRMEGPFGDHFGHYSHAAEFPVFHLSAVTRKRNPIYPATVVGIPPMEDKFLGDATQLILGPLARLIHSEISGPLGVLRSRVPQSACRVGGPAVQQRSDEDRSRTHGDVAAVADEVHRAGERRGERPELR